MTRGPAAQPRHGVEDPWRTLARSVPDGFVLLFDADLRVVAADGSALATFGYDGDALAGRRIQDVFPAWLVRELEPRYRSALAGERVTWERDLAGRIFQFVAGPALEGASPSAGAAPPAGTVVALDMTEQRRSERTWAALHAIATEVARAESSPEQICEQIVDQLHRVFVVDSAAVFRITGPRSAQVLAARPELTGPDAVTTFTETDTSAVARVARTGRPALVRYDQRGGGLGSVLGARGLHAGAAAPIQRQGRAWGAIGIGSATPGGIDARTLEQLGAFADLVELALGNSEAWATLTEAATTDGLTGLPNRRMFHSHVEHEVERARRHRTPLSVAVLDLDHFKTVNDRFGHPVGDEVLAEFGRRMRRSSRAGELVARIGGEEFGLILPGTDAEAAVRAVTRLCRATLSEPYPRVGTMTASAGVAALDDGGTEVLLARADDALYAAKRGGRDRVQQWAPVAR